MKKAVHVPYERVDRDRETFEEEDSAHLKSEDSLCWKHLTEQGCTSADCEFIHGDQKEVGWRPSKQQEDLLKRRIRTRRGLTWDWSKIRSLNLDQNMFN